jgi:flagellar protein FlaG
MASDLSVTAAATKQLTESVPVRQVTVDDVAPRVELNIPEMPKIDYTDAIATIQEAMKVLNEKLASKNNSIRFRVDETLDRSIITVVNDQTGEVVRQLPTDEMLQVARNIESLKGILVKEWV